MRGNHETGGARHRFGMSPLAPSDSCYRPSGVPSRKPVRGGLIFHGSSGPNVFDDLKPCGVTVASRKK